MRNISYEYLKFDQHAIPVTHTNTNTNTEYCNGNGNEYEYEYEYDWVRVTIYRMTYATKIIRYGYDTLRQRYAYAKNSQESL